MLEDTYNFNKKAIEWAVSIFNNAAQDEFTLHDYATIYKDLINNDFELSMVFASNLIHIALVDGAIGDQEEKSIKEIIKLFSLPSNTYENLLFEAKFQLKLSLLEVKMYGSGFIVSKDGFILTCHHVIKDCPLIKIRTVDKICNAEIISVDRKADLCLLKIEGEYSPIKHVSYKARVGQDIFVYGYPEPKIQGYSPKLTKGIINSLSGCMDDVRHLQIDAKVYHGNSGGPIVDLKTGGLVGIVYSVLKSPQKVNYAIKQEIIIDFLNKFPGIADSLQYISDERDFSATLQEVTDSTVQVFACKSEGLTHEEFLDMFEKLNDSNGNE